MSPPPASSLPASMSAIVVETPGGPEALVLRQLPLPVPSTGELLIRVRAAGVNYPDVMQRRGRYDPPPGASPHPGLEVSGTVVVAAGGHQPGDEVVALCNGGGYAEYVAVPAGQVLPHPAPLTSIEAAALPETFFTIAQTLVMRATVDPGMRVLVHGAAGGIGGAAILVSRALGAIPYAVVSSAEKAAYALSLGAEACIDHTREDVPARLLELTAGHGADRVISLSGGQVNRNLAALAQRGIIIQIATLGGGHEDVDIGLLMRKHATLFGSTLRPQTSETKAAIAATLRDWVWPAIASGAIGAPRVTVLPLAEAAEAHRRMEQRDNFGKLVLVTDYGRAG